MRLENGSRLRGARRAAAAALLLVAALTAPAASGKRSSDDAVRRAPDFEWSGKVPRGGTIEIRGVNGAIEASPTGGGQVEVTAVKHARRSDPDEVRVEVSQSGNGYTICTVYPRGSGNEPTDCDDDSGWHSRTHDNDVVVDYRVRVPAGVRFVGKTVNGSIEALDLTGPIEAMTVNGSVDVATSDQAEAQTVNGSIHAALGSARWSDAIEFKTVNGRIHLELPPNVGAEVQASTMNGNIETDFPLTVRGRIGHRRLNGTLGKGGSLLRLQTVNGGIEIASATH